ncbi:MAG TPA: hypothetical protein VML19_08470 [Verrucomicrobiae bacterium]|nr:hypothetical protein [Verrucomicrobiae bacterium]
MRLALLLSVISVLPWTASAGDGKTPIYPVKYEGGSLHVTPGAMKATLGTEQIVFKAGRQRIKVAASAITEISYGNNVRRRFGAPVLDVVPFMKLGEAETHYVGVSWATGETGAKSEAVFRLSSSDCRDFVAELERITGKKAVDTNQVPTVVRYGL